MMAMMSHAYMYLCNACVLLETIKTQHRAQEAVHIICRALCADRFDVLSKGRAVRSTRTVSSLYTGHITMRGWLSATAGQQVHRHGDTCSYTQKQCESASVALPSNVNFSRACEVGQLV